MHNNGGKVNFSREYKQMIENAPVNKKMFDGEVLAPGWLQFFSSLDGLQGEWLNESWPLTFSGMTSTEEPEINICFRGSLVHFSMKWTKSVIFNSATCETPNEIEFIDSVLCVWDGSALQGGAIISDNTISFPDGAFTNCRVIGSAIIREQ